MSSFQARATLSRKGKTTNISLASSLMVHRSWVPRGQSTDVWSDLPPSRTNLYGKCFIPGWQAESIEPWYHLYRWYHLTSPLYHKGFMGRSSIPEGPSQKSLDQVKKPRTCPLPAPICKVGVSFWGACGLALPPGLVWGCQGPAYGWGFFSCQGPAYEGWGFCSSKEIGFI